MSAFDRVVELLDASIAAGGDPDPGPHGAFWRDVSKEEFIAMEVLGLPLLVVGDSGASNLVSALRGRAPFGKDQGVPDAEMRRMPGGLPPMPEADIQFIENWIDAGCPDEMLDLKATA